MQKFDLSLLSKFRIEIMGIATFLIIICHAPVNGVILHPLLKKIAVLGNLGVELFFLMSGIGMANSLKNSDNNLIKWYKRRFIRLLVPYLIIAIPWFAVHAIKYNESTGVFVLNVLTISYWTAHKGAWFVAILIPLYFLTPIFQYILKTKWANVFLCISIAFTSLCTLIPSTGILYNFLWAIHRLPCFFIGLALMKYIDRNQDLNYWIIFFGSILSMIVLRVIDVSSGWLWPGILMFIVLICVIFEKNKNNLSIFRWIGIISLESYLMNICLGDLMPVLDSNGYLRYTLIIFVGILTAFLLNRYISTPLIRICSKI